MNTEYAISCSANLYSLVAIALANSTNQSSPSSMMEICLFSMLYAHALTVFNGTLSLFLEGGRPRDQAAAQEHVLLAAGVPARARESENRQTARAAAQPQHRRGPAAQGPLSGERRKRS